MSNSNIRPNKIAFEISRWFPLVLLAPLFLIIFYDVPERFGALRVFYVGLAIVLGIASCYSLWSLPKKKWNLTERVRHIANVQRVTFIAAAIGGALAALAYGAREDADAEILMVIAIYLFSCGGVGMILEPVRQHLEMRAQAD